MIARKNTNLSHPKQTSLKLKILPLQVTEYYHAPKSTSDESIIRLVTNSEIDDEGLRQRFAERNWVHQRLLAAGLLVTDIEIPDIPEDWEDNLELPIQLPPDSKTIAEWLEEERGEY